MAEKRLTETDIEDIQATLEGQDLGFIIGED